MTLATPLGGVRLPVAPLRGVAARARTTRCAGPVHASANARKAALATIAATPATLFIQLASAAESDEARVAVASTYNLVNELASSDPLDPETAKTIAGFLGPFFSLATIAFIVRIVMTWYPSVPYTKLPWVVAYVPTEPLLKPTRSLVPPVGGVDVSPIIWVMAISFMNEILLGKQGLLILLSNKQMMG